MYSYNEKTRVLKIQQIPEDDIELSLVQYQKDSYRKFCEVTLPELLTDFIKKLDMSIGHRITIGPKGFYRGTPPISNWKREMRVMPDRYIPLLVDLDIEGMENNGVEIFRLPYMDDDAVLNINGERRICNLQMTAADGVSYDPSHETFSISIPERNISILNRAKGSAVKWGTRTIPLVDIVRMYCATELPGLDLLNLFVSAPIVAQMTGSNGGNYNSYISKLSNIYTRSTDPSTPLYTTDHRIIGRKLVYAITDEAGNVIADKDTIITAEIVKATEAAGINIIHTVPEKDNLYDTYHSVPYRLGVARESLNRALSLDRAEGRVLSRDLIGEDGTLIAKAGTTVTKELLSEGRKHFINALYVKAKPDIVGYKIRTNNPTGMIMLHEIPVGTKVTKLIRNAIPAFMREDFRVRKRVVFVQDRTFETEDTYYYASTPVMINTAENITTDLVDLLYSTGYTDFEVSRTGDDFFTATFEEEIVGNYTMQLSEYYGIDIPEGRSADEWCYFHNNHALKPTEDRFLTAYDWIGLLSLTYYTQRHPHEHILVDKDEGMLKRVLGPNELFRQAFEQAVPIVMRKRRRNWTNVASNASSMNIDLRPLYQEWRKRAWAMKVLVAANYQNPVIHTQQANVIDMAPNVKNIPNAMRMLAMGYYGRICPYETPMGKRLGATTTRAIGSRINEDGVLETPYLKVIRSNNGTARISDYVEWFNAQDEVHERIGDKLSLVYNPDGTFQNTKVMARVPDGHNNHTVEVVDAHTLDYVNYHSCQHLSMTAALLPFIGATDSARLTLGTGMMKQSILVQHNEKPRMYTSMYRKMFEHSPTYCGFCKKAGFVIDVRNDAIVIGQPHPNSSYKPGVNVPLSKSQDLFEEAVNIDPTYGVWECQEYPVQATTITRRSINTINYHVRVGQWVEEGECLYDSSIAKQGIYSPGCNFFVAYIPDGYDYEDAVEMSESAAARFTSIGLETVDIKLPFDAPTQPTIIPAINRYVRENGVIAEFIKDREHKNLSYKAPTGLHSGMVLDIAHDRDERGSFTRYKGYMVAFNTLRPGDKVIGRHSNKGTNSIVQPNSKMPKFANGQVIDIVLNPLGVPSRMNIGQNFEGYLGFVAYLLDINVESDSFNGATKADCKELMGYVWSVANEGADVANAKYPGIPSNLRRVGKEREDFIRQWEGCFNADGTAYLINPRSGKPYGRPVTFGMPYMLKLEHEVNKKIKVRGSGLEEEYSKIYQQPLGGTAGGGERVGEMEFVNMLSYGMDKFLDETMNAASDNVTERVYSMMADIGFPGEEPPIRNPDSYFDRAHAVPHAVEHFRYLLEVLGVSMDADFLPSCLLEDATRRAIPDRRAISAFHQEMKELRDAQAEDSRSLPSNDVFDAIGEI